MTKPFIKWAGGKTQLLPQLLKAARAAGEFNSYHEPFLGGGAMFFGMYDEGLLKHRRAYLSDSNYDLIRAWCEMANNTEAVVFHLLCHSGRDCEKHFLDERGCVHRNSAEEAARFIYINKTCFNGLYRVNSKGKFNVPYGHRKPRYSPDEEIKEVGSVIKSNSVVQCLGFQQALSGLGEGSLIYLDPPYIPTTKTSFTKYTVNDFKAEDHRELAGLVRECSERGAKIILSNAWTSYTAELYEGFHASIVKARRNINRDGAKRGAVDEVIITNFPVPALGSFVINPRSLTVDASCEALRKALRTKLVGLVTVDNVNTVVHNYLRSITLGDPFDDICVEVTEPTPGTFEITASIKLGQP